VFRARHHSSLPSSHAVALLAACSDTVSTRAVQAEPIYLRPEESPQVVKLAEGEPRRQQARPRIRKLAHRVVDMGSGRGGPERLEPHRFCAARSRAPGTRGDGRRCKHTANRPPSSRSGGRRRGDLFHDPPRTTVPLATRAWRSVRSRGRLFAPSTSGNVPFSRRDPRGMPSHPQRDRRQRSGSADRALLRAELESSPSRGRPRSRVARPSATRFDLPDAASCRRGSSPPEGTRRPTVAYPGAGSTRTARAPAARHGSRGSPRSVRRGGGGRGSTAVVLRALL
jgi:hypothetical protein